MTFVLRQFAPHRTMINLYTGFFCLVSFKSVCVFLGADAFADTSIYILGKEYPDSKVYAFLS